MNTVFVIDDFCNIGLCLKKYKYPITEFNLLINRILKNIFLNQVDPVNPVKK